MDPTGAATAGPETALIRPVLPEMTRAEWLTLLGTGWLLEVTGVAWIVSPLATSLPLTTAQLVVLLTLDLLAWIPGLVLVFLVFDRTPGRGPLALAARGVALLGTAALQAWLSSFAALAFGRVAGLDFAALARIWPLGVAANLPYSALGAVVVAIAHFVMQRIHLARRSLARNAELREAATAARLQALAAELHPHFLFNALNGIAELVHHEPARAEAMLLRLGTLLRRTLEDRHEGTVPLREELARLDDYLALQQMRFADRLEVTRRLEPAALPLPVPPMLLQPIVENALIHGVERSATAGRVTIEARVEGDRLVLVVRDDGPGPGGASRPGTGVGLHNVRERLRTMYGPGASVVLARGAEGGAEVTIVLPGAAARAPAA